jgi:DNA-binding MarR family transcriptional regulator
MGQHSEYDLLFLLHDVARLVRVEADKRARLQGMTRAQWGLLLRVAGNPGLSQKEVADLLEVEPISVARLVDRLAASGLIERRADAQDRRIWRLHLQPAGMARLAEIKLQCVDLAAFIAGGVAPEIRDAMLAGLTQMKTTLVQAPPTKPKQAVPAKLKQAKPARSKQVKPANSVQAEPACLEENA